MVTIPEEIQSMIENERVIVVGSVDDRGIPNVSPRSTLSWNNNAIYWLEFFDHKSRKNFKHSPWVSIAVFNNPKQRGYQLKGKVNFLKTGDKRSMVFKIMKGTPNAIEKVYEEKIDNKDLEVVEFEPRAIYSLDPRQETGRRLAMDKDDETISVLG